MSNDWMNLSDVAMVPAAQTRPAPLAPDALEVSQGSVMATVPGTLIGGALPGPLVEGVFEVLLAQLRPAETCVLHAGYDAEQDPQGVRRAYEALGSLGRQPQPFVCLPAPGQHVEIDGGVLPIYAVYSDLPMLAAMRVARMSRAQIRIPAVRDEGELLLYLLTGHQLHRRLTLLQKCDVVNTLCSPPWSYAQAQVAAHLAHDEETSEKPSASYVSRLIQAARQPQPIRELLGAEVLRLSHVRYLAERVADERERILVARYVAQERLSVSRLVTLLNGLYPYSGEPTLELRDDGEQITVRDLTATLEVARPQPPVFSLEAGTPLMATSVLRVKQMASRKYQNAVVVMRNADPRLTAIASESMDALRDWLEGVRGHRILVSAFEEHLLAARLAVYEALAVEGLLTTEGRLASRVIPSEPEQRQA